MESDYSEEDSSYEASQEEEDGQREANLLETGDKVGGIKGFMEKDSIVGLKCRMMLIGHTTIFIYFSIIQLKCPLARLNTPLIHRSPSI